MVLGLLSYLDSRHLLPCCDCMPVCSKHFGRTPCKALHSTSIIRDQCLPCAMLRHLQLLMCQAFNPSPPCRRSCRSAPECAAATTDYSHNNVSRACLESCDAWVEAHAKSCCHRPPCVRSASLMGMHAVALKTTFPLCAMANSLCTHCRQCPF